MPSAFHWTGRQDPEDGDLAKRWHQIITQTPVEGTVASLIGFACDLGVERNKGRVGAAKGPEAIRKALCNLAWHDESGTVCDSGDIPVDRARQTSLEAAQKALGDRISTMLSQTPRVIVLGGGHETAAGSVRGLLEHLRTEPESRIGIINLDAHFDLRKPGVEGISSGTPFYQAREMLQEKGQDLRYLCLGISETGNTKALFKRCEDWGFRYLPDHAVRPHLLDSVFAEIDSFLQDCDYLYLTLDLDVLPHWQMPAVSAPSAHGVPLEVLEDIIRYLGTRDVKWLLSDLVEFNPEYDTDNRGARVAARLCHTILQAMKAKAP
ncbi:formimidoylglutamase [Kiloniella sp. b19]|uniref:formimidoylglutamase n=1 Tax=Kiloniella sp. GXU_MW_B19 TaxID=3141326 RepID=UPI0031D935F0